MRLMSKRALHIFVAPCRGILIVYGYLNEAGNRRGAHHVFVFDEDPRYSKWPIAHQ